MDYAIDKYLKDEEARQNAGIELIASENYPSMAVRLACSSIAIAKYAEGYPNHRYYGGCEFIDKIEQTAINRACSLFNCTFANVQPHSGSQANFAAYHAFLKKGDKVLSLQLNDGGHLTHGSSVSFSADWYNFVHFPLGTDGHLDYKIIKKFLYQENPQMLLLGFSAYPYSIDFEKAAKIVKEYNTDTGNKCFFMVDMAHIAGIVATRLCQNPCDYADVVTTTTHKTLRGPRGGLILWNNPDYTIAINKSVFPYTQGGPLENIIAAKAICFDEDDNFSFRQYILKVLENTKTCNDALEKLGGFVSGTDNHLFLLNTLKTFGLTGLEAQIMLEEIGITTNKNMIHGDTLSPSETSGLRIGFAAATTRGCSKEDAEMIANIIWDCLFKRYPTEKLKSRVLDITNRWDKVSNLTYKNG
jgi:glycine hydroxymethyltransferase